MTVHKEFSEALRLVGEHEELTLLQNTTSDAMLAVNQGLSVIAFNARLALIFDMRSEVAAATSLDRIVHNDEVVEAFRQVVETGQPKSLTAVKFNFNDGARLYFSISISPLRKAQLVTGAVGIFHDVTELKMAEQMRIDFVANVSHELRTPLTSIQGYVETLIGDSLSKKPLEHEYLEVIQRNAQRLISLIDDLLDLSTLESNPGALHKERIDTLAATERVLSPIRHALQAKQQEVEINASGASVVFADLRRLEQVMTNLLDNACKYTPVSGRIMIEWVENQNSPGILLKISNSGSGIPAKHLGRLFERFYRVDKARSRDLGGTGLGLAIVKHIMQSHQGSVEVDSTPNVGTTFVCAFPKS